MNPSRRAPQQLKIVAYLFMIEGFLCLATLVTVWRGLGWVNIFGVGAIPIGWGLLKLNLRSYRWAFVSIWYYLLLAVTIGMLLVLQAGTGESGWPDAVGFLIGACIFILKAWQLNILHSPPVGRAFELRDEG